MRTLVAMLLVFALGGCAQSPAPVSDPAPAPINRETPPPINYGTKSLLLKTGMTERQVTAILGQPNKAELSVCGGSVGRPWPCKSWAYGGEYHNGMSIMFRPEGDGWVINSWRVFGQ